MECWEQNCDVVFERPAFVHDNPTDNPLTAKIVIYQHQKRWFIGWTITNNSSQDPNTELSVREFPRIALDSLISCHVNPASESNLTSVRFLVDKDKEGGSLLFNLRNNDFKMFMETLKKTVHLEQMEPGLFVVASSRGSAWNKEVSLFKEENAADLLTRFTKNPYSTTMTSLAKFKDMFADFVAPNFSADFRDSEASGRLPPSLRDAISFQVDNDYQLVNQAPVLPTLPKCTRSCALDAEMWQSFQNEDGSIKMENDVKSIIFSGGIEHCLRKQVWKYLLGIYEWNWSVNQLMTHEICIKEKYEKIKLQWQSVSAEQENNWSDYRKFRDLIEKDVARTDRNIDIFKNDNCRGLKLLHDILMTYMMYNFDLGYVQGMSDLLAPLIYVFDDEVDSFWAFVGFMKKCGNNFLSDQLCIKRQLQHLKCLLEIVSPDLSNLFRSNGSDNMIFCFRWILILFKREFTFNDICLLWEVFWSHKCPNFHLFFCLAILETQKSEIIANKLNSADTLKHINNMALNIDVNQVLCIAEGIYHQFASVQNELPPEISQILDLKTS